MSCFLCGSAGEPKDPLVEHEFEVYVGVLPEDRSFTTIKREVCRSCRVAHLTASIRHEPEKKTPWRLHGEAGG